MNQELRSRKLFITAAGLILFSFSNAMLAQQERAAFFGDLHLHTGLSFDSASSGIYTTPDDAYRYALGETVQYMGREVRRNRALDFLAVTDHAEYLGVAPEAGDPAGLFADTEWPEKIAAADSILSFMRLFSPSAFRGTDPAIPEFVTEPIISSYWQQQMAAAERYNQPGKFTSLIAFEWSPMPGGAHLHRNVIFRGPEYPARPFSALDSPRPEDLWSYVESLREEGIESVLIPHNSNMSQGLMFSTTDSYGDPITENYAARRLANERLVEIAQIKGTSESRPEFGQTDEFAGFELMNLAIEEGADPAGGYIRPALARGLEMESTMGINPFRFGLIGSSDFHSGVSATEEDNFVGALGYSDDMSKPDMVLNELNPITGESATVFSAGALTGLWAEENTRESLFAAMKRREAFATSGTRIRVRMFAGWVFDESFLESREWVSLAYAQGYAMGSDVPWSGTDAPMKLVIHAVKDPEGANLDRVQVVKIWREDGEPRESIYDVAWSGDRAPDAQGKLPAVGNTVDLSSAGYTNDIGAAQLATVWTDPDFDPDQSAIYYVRVLEIPTPRWSTYLAVRNNMAIPGNVPATIQERAWTSPVFYSP